MEAKTQGPPRWGQLLPAVRLQHAVCGGRNSHGLQMSATIEDRARRLCRHTVVYTAVQDIQVAVLALQGRTTKSISKQVGISESMVQYRIMKAQRSMNTRFRADYRGGCGALAVEMSQATYGLAARFVNAKIAPKFIRFAKKGVGRIQEREAQ